MWVTQLKVGGVAPMHRTDILRRLPKSPRRKREKGKDKKRSGSQKSNANKNTEDIPAGGKGKGKGKTKLFLPGSQGPDLSTRYLQKP